MRVNTNNKEARLSQIDFWGDTAIQLGESSECRIERLQLSPNSTYQYENQSNVLRIIFLTDSESRLEISHSKEVFSLKEHVGLWYTSDSTCFRNSQSTNILFYVFTISIGWIEANLGAEATLFMNKIRSQTPKPLTEFKLNALKHKEINDLLSDTDNNSVFGYLYILNEMMVPIISEFYFNEKDTQVNISINDVERLQGIRQKVLSSTVSTLNIEQMASAAGMSTTKFKTSFKKLFGQSPYSYFLSERMNKAKELIINQNKTVTEVSETFGYNHTSNFTKVFKRYTTQLPSKISIGKQ